MTQENSDIPSMENNQEPDQPASGGWRTATIIIVVVVVLSLIAVAALAVTGNLSGEQEQVVESFIEINEPENGAVLDIPQPVTVSGTAGGLFEGNLAVQALDQDGNVLAQEATTIAAPDAGTGGKGPWSVQLVVPVKPGSPGHIYAFSQSPEDSSIVASADIDITFGEEVVIESYIEITAPGDGAELDTANPVTVSGMGGGLFEGNVVVEALDADGNVLAQEATIVDSPEAGTGGEGPWTVELSIEAALGTTGDIHAFSPSPVDGSEMASDRVEVSYSGGDMQEDEVKLEDHLWVLVSLGGEEVLEGTQITANFEDSQVAGSAGCNNYFASYESTDTELTIGPAGSTLMFCAEPEGLMDQETQYLGLLGTAATYQIEDGLLKVFDGASEEILIYDAAVTGTVTYLQRIALPEDAVVEVKLSDVSLADAPAVVIGEQTITSPGQVPIPFEVTYDPAEIDPRFTYAIQVRINNSAGELLFINTSAYNVITRGNPSTLEVIVEPVS